MSSFDPPLARQFAVRQLRLMREGLGAHEAFSKVEQEMAPRLRALKRWVYATHGQVARFAGCSCLPVQAKGMREAHSLGPWLCSCVGHMGPGFAPKPHVCVAVPRCRHHGATTPGSYLSLVQKEEAEQLDAAMQQLHQAGGSSQGESDQQR